MPASGAGTRGTVNRSTLRQQLADALRDEVLAGRLQPGREFTVKHIAESYEVSATPVREALFDLAAQGLLASDQHKGFRVREYSVAEFRGMVEARSLVVSGVHQRLAIAASDLAPDRLAVLRRRAEEAARAARAGDLDVLIGYDLRFWQELATMIGNPHIAEFLHQLRVRCWVFSVLHLRAELDLRAADCLWSGHEEVVAALARCDEEAVYELLAAHDRTALGWADRLEGRAEHTERTGI
ncbi:GntR family transcriptional regulator [Streptomyces candidus]|uniref:DNA-binding GntR family transcriptional regulator n=1 Tax=Streptomyces candidus TaxID=67283 RepID=A0A7X0HID2_9ACTN|nr:GntR family transcriptional regulator [Streptomyces candidus]MBB6438110.1 DNA-binding GntR family transcriptional regulator [Streptomyces candidus]GHH39251.1 GntR family transcriptional regulator [Streptomyces candidus]